MIFLSGLIGMMALGSLAFVAIQPDDDELEDDGYSDMPGTEPQETEDGSGGAFPEPDGFTQDAQDPEPDKLAAQTPPPAYDIQVEARDDAADADTPLSLFGTEDDDEIDGSGADEQIRGLDGSDTMDGGAGDDTLLGQVGPDDLYGGAGDDVLSGGIGNDTVMGDAGDDLLSGGVNSDALHGRDGDDTLTGDGGRDTLFGGNGDDLLSGVTADADGQDSDMRDYLNGGAGDDLVVASDDDVVWLGAGSDSLLLGDWMTGPGAQVLDFDEAEDQLMVVYDELPSGETPDLGMRLSAEDPSVTEILLDDQVLATMPTEDAPALESVVLIAEQTLGDLGAAGTGLRLAG